jgi:1-acyl-sn-glycerol-3-phosphate acyltransferase
MPLAPLKNPSSLGPSLLGLLKGLVSGITLFLLVMVCNALQMASCVFWPISRRLVRRLNREIANAWWTICDFWSERFWGIEVRITGDEIPDLENAVVLSNHQTMSDITTLFRFARRKRRLGDLKWFVKDVLKYVPGIGWGMVFLDCVFLKRNWKTDKAGLSKILGKFSREKIPMWTISFVEGTRVRPHKLKKSQEYAKKHGLPHLKHLLVPRHRGFVATVHGLRSHIDAVYDATIAYEHGVPSLWQWCKAYTRVVHLHVKRYPVATLPESDDDLKEWLLERYVEKDLWLEGKPGYGSGTIEA